MKGKYEAMIRRYACSWDEVGGGCVVDIGTARNVTEKADAEIADLRAKCKKLAGAVVKAADDFGFIVDQEEAIELAREVKS